MEGEATWQSGPPINRGELVYVADQRLSMVVTIDDGGGMRTEVFTFEPGDLVRFLLDLPPGSKADLRIHFQELSGGEEETGIPRANRARSQRRGHGARRTRDEERSLRRRPRRGTGDGRADRREEKEEEVRLWSEINAIIQTLEGDD